MAMPSDTLALNSTRGLMGRMVMYFQPLAKSPDMALVLLISQQVISPQAGI
jgi:hypothetical protein